MNMTDADNLGRQMVAGHLSGWRFSWNNRKTSFGVCNYAKRTIFLSAYLTATETPEATEQTLLHEIAHAIAGPGTGHGPVWKAHAIRLGVKNPGTTRAPSAPVNPVTPKWVMVFKNEVVKGYHRKPGSKTFFSLRTTYIRGRRAETYGKMDIMTYADYLRKP